MEPVTARVHSPKPSTRRELKFQEFHGATVELAEQSARGEIGEGLIGIEVVRDTEARSTTAQGWSSDEASATATRRVPKEALSVDATAIIQEGASGRDEVTEFEERDARKAWRRQAPRGGEISSIICTTPSKQGIVGLGRRPGTWQVEWSSPYIAEVSFTMPAVVRARFFG